MGRIVYAESHRQDDVDAGEGVDGDVPKVEEPNQVHKGQDDAYEYHEANDKVGKQQEGDESNASHGKAQVAPKLLPDYFVSLPSRIDLKKTRQTVDMIWQLKLVLRKCMAEEAFKSS